VVERRHYKVVWVVGPALSRGHHTPQTAGWTDIPPLPSTIAVSGSEALECHVGVAL
jgi:hypothetical protein